MADIGKIIQSKFPSEGVKALINIIYTANWINSVHNDRLKPHGITIQQFNILRILRGAEEAIPVQQVKDRMVERAPNATRLMDKLCDKSLIVRSRCDHDRRVVYVAITKEGRLLLSTIGDDLSQDIISRLNTEEAKELNRLLDKLR